MKVPIVIPIGKLLINECRMERKYFSLQKIEALFRSILRGKMIGTQLLTNNLARVVLAVRAQNMFLGLFGQQAGRGERGNTIRARYWLS